MAKTLRITSKEELYIDFETELPKARMEGDLSSAKKIIERNFNLHGNAITNFIEGLNLSASTNLVFCPLLSFYNRLPFIAARSLQFVFNNKCSPYEVYYSGAFGLNNEIEILKNGDLDLPENCSIVIVKDVYNEILLEEFIAIIKRDLDVSIEGILTIS